MERNVHNHLFPALKSDKLLVNAERCRRDCYLDDNSQMYMCDTCRICTHVSYMSSKKQQDPKKTRNAAFYLYTCYSFNSYQTKRNCFDLFFFSILKS